MSATMTMTMPSPMPMPSITTSMSTTTPCCPSCGTSLALSSSSSDPDPHTALLDAQRQIEDLQAQVRLLNQKATAAVDRWADYEDELSRLRAASLTSASAASTGTTETTTTTATYSYSNNATTPTPSPSVPPSSPRDSFLSVGASRLSQLLSPRKSVPNLPAAALSSSSGAGAGGGRSSLTGPKLPVRPSSSSAAPTADDLQAALMREQALRKAAEGKLDDTSREVEELSVTLFEQANEMVATERRARAKLEERLGVLEKRESEKRGRLERLEGAIDRIDRCKSLLGSANG